MRSSPPTQTPIQLPAPTGWLSQPWSVRKLCAVLASFGPAAILASMSIGAGETIVVVRAGAWAGYDLLWVVLLSCVVKGVFVTYMLGRYTALSGEHIGQRLVRLPGPRGWLLVLLVGADVLFAPLVWVAIAKPCGSLVQYWVGGAWLDPLVGAAAASNVAVNLYTTIFIASALLVSLTLTYERLEKEQLIICGILVAGTMLGTAMVWPDFRAAASGALLRIGRFPDTLPSWAPAQARDYPWLNLATVFAYVGGSVSGYIAYANWISIRGWGLTAHPEIERIRLRAAQSERIDYLPEDAQQRRRLWQLVAPLRWDVGLGALVLFIVTAAFMTAGAAVLYGKHSRFEGWSLLTNQAYIWHNIHPWLVPVYYVTVLAALWGTLTALPEVYARVAHQFARAIWPEIRWTYEGLRAWIAAFILLTSQVVIWCNVDFDLLTQLAGLFTANLAVAAIAVAAFYLNHQLPPSYRMRGLMLAGAVGSALILVIAAGMSTYGLLHKLLG